MTNGADVRVCVCVCEAEANVTNGDRSYGVNK